MVAATRVTLYDMAVRVACLLILAALVAGSVTPAVGAPGARPAVLTGFVAGSGADFQALSRTGARAVKLLADWSAIEPAAGTYRWEELDAAVGAAEKARLSVALVLAYTPKWASLATGADRRDPAIWSRQPPRRVEDWARFVSSAARRYRGRVRQWQIWTALNLPIWRGTAREYFALVSAARTAARAVDPQNRIVLSTPHGADLISVRRAMLAIPGAFDVIALNPRGIPPEGLLRPLGTLHDRVFSGGRKPLWIEWDPRDLGDRASWSAQIVKVMAVAAAAGVERVDLAVEPAAAAPALRALSAAVGPRPYVGYLKQGRALAFIFGAEGPAAVAWSAAGEVPFALGERAITVGTEPALIQGLSSAVATRARETAGAQGFPLFAPARDFSQAAEVSAQLGRANAEEGLYNTPFRSRRNGALEVVQAGGAEAVRTSVARGIVLAYFDVDDTFMYYVDGRYAVEVRVEVYGASAAGQLGFNLFYDSMADLRFSPWQVVEARDGWVTHTIRLTDAAFANTWGWDFAINAAGNRHEDLTIRAVTVRKTPR